MAHLLNLETHSQEADGAKQTMNFSASRAVFKIAHFEKINQLT
jgi:hypothetical protein